MIEGNINIPTQGGRYFISDMDEGEDVSYYGFLNRNGIWYILKHTSADNTFRYIKGMSNYSASWDGRTSLVYNYYNISEL